MIFPCDWVDFFRLHLNFQGCTTELMKQKWLLEKRWCVRPSSFLVVEGGVFHGSLDGKRKDMWRKLAPKYLPVLKRNRICPTKTNMTTENPPFEDIFWY